jgi:hypothetical protein
MLSSITTYLGSLLSVAVGWFLHELSDTLKVRREDRRAVGKVLAELLEIRHQLVFLPTYLAEVQRLFALPPEAQTLIHTKIVEVLSPALSRAEEKYNDAIDSIKGSLPLLAFELRGKDLLRHSFDQVRSLVAADAAALAAMPKVESAATEEALPVLNKLLLKVAWMHGFRTWLGVRRNLRKNEDISSDVKRLFDSMLKSVAVPPPSNTPPSS